MTRFFLLPLLFSLSLPHSFSQIADDFSDGDFAQNPTWQGDLANFTVNAAGELQLNATAPGTSLLATQGNIADSSIWSLRFRLEFAPSNNNLLRIYLLADQLDLPLANGYFLEIGETGSLDALRLFRQDAGAKTLLATGQPGLVANNPDIRLRVKRTVSGAWELEAGTGSDALQPQLAVQDAAFGGGANRFFGFQCTYTATNVAKFFFDDIAILPDVPDTEPPLLLVANAADDTTVLVVFNEDLDSISAVNTAHYDINGGIGQPQSAVLLGDRRTVRLSLNNSLATGNYVLQTSGIRDVLGNASLTQTADFQFVKIETAVEFDVIINEIMADPDPPAGGLPNVEWLEIFNRSAKSIDLASLRIQDATGSPVQLPPHILPPDAYIALTATNNVTALQSATLGAVLGVSIGTTALNNDGDILTISDLNGNVIDRVAYSVDWHTDPSKDGGGWSLERINPTLPCLGSENWQSSPALPGGTPGLQNASFQNTPDNEPPRLLSAFPESPTSLLLIFSEGLEKTVAEISADYHISPTRAVASAIQLPDDRSRIRLTLGDPLQASTLYALTVAGSVTDCSGNGVPATDTAFVILPEAASAHDIVINEIMAAPSPPVGSLPEVEWLEIFNRSSKAIDLATLVVQEGASSPSPLPSKLLLPGQYLALTAAANVAALQAATSGNISGIALSATALNNDSDVLTISDLNGKTIDRVTYNSDWHTDAGKAGGGWSLERINPALPCLGRENWQSCPVLPGGTPGLQNASFQNTFDDDAPRLYWAFTESATSLLLTFSEDLDKNTADAPASYRIEPPRNIASAEQLTGRAQVRLLLAEPLEPATLYAITAESSLEDCSGNMAFVTDTAFVGLPEKPEPQDIVVNEIMFNPATGNARYVEFFNRSDKVFSWADFFLADFSSDTSVEKITQSRLSIPGRYDVFSTHPNNIRTHFSNIRPIHVTENKLPSIRDNEGNITLYWSKSGEAIIVDAFDYSRDFHNALLSISDREGVALERIDVETLTNLPSNWTSASPTKTGAPGTPTLPNSQRLSPPNIGGNDLIQLSAERLSPDDDGFEDFLDIRYALPQSGYSATMNVFDAEGIPVKRLVRQELIGTEGSLRWDGDLDDGTRARPGIYILFFEIFAPTGSTEHVKKAVAVVGKF